jgi:EmrB/QacA subfamily drug resistance transporter
LLLISLDNTVLNVALPSIARSLGASASQLQWMVDAYAVVFAGLLLSLGALGDRAGRKWVFIGGLVVFGGGSAFAAWSRTPDVLTVARATMGVGAAALMPCTLSILTNVFTAERDRVRAIGIWSGTTGIGVALGPILGGFLLAHFWWGSVFLVNVPIAALGIIGAIWLVPNSKNPLSSRPDAIGAFLSMLGLGLLLWGIIEAPGRGWSSPVIVGSLTAALVLVVAFIVWERRIDHAMLPLRFFASRRYSVAISALALVLFALLGMFFLFTQYLQFDLGYSPLSAGVRIIPVAAALLVIAPLSVLAARAIGTKAVVATGLALVALAFALLSRTSVTGTYRVPSGRGFRHQRHRHATRRRVGRRRARHRAQPALPASHGPRGLPGGCAGFDSEAHRQLPRRGTRRGAPSAKEFGPPTRVGGSQRLRVGHG